MSLSYMSLGIKIGFSIHYITLKFIDMHQHDNLKLYGNVFGWGGNMENRKQKREKSLIEVENWRDFGGVYVFSP